MCAQRLEDLDAWQLAMDVKREVVALTRRGPVLADRRFRDDLLASAGAIAKNISEGFGRYRPAEFANKVRIALGELRETETALLQGCESGYFSAPDVDRIRHLIERAVKVSMRLHTYLDGCAQQGLFERPSRRPPTCEKPERRERGSNGNNDER